MNQKSDKIKKKTSLEWLLWWRVDQEELEMQVREYKTLKITKSAKGVSLLCLLFSSILTICFVQFLHIDSSAYLDVAIMLVLGIFIYRGHRWAMIAAMLFWTSEKLLQIIEPIKINGHVSGGGVGMLIWWAIYMHAFYLAFKVETKRKKASEL